MARADAGALMAMFLDGDSLIFLLPRDIANDFAAATVQWPGNESAPGPRHATTCTYIEVKQ
jgi:hypothetical protein